MRTEMINAPQGIPVAAEPLHYLGSVHYAPPIRRVSVTDVRVIMGETAPQ